MAIGDYAPYAAGGLLGEDYIEKPFVKEDLKKRIDNILKNTSE